MGHADLADIADFLILRIVLGHADLADIADFFDFADMWRLRDHDCLLNLLDLHEVCLLTLQRIITVA